MLDIDYPSLDHIELVLSDAGGRNTLKRWTLGDHHPFSQRPLASRSFAVPLGILASLVLWMIRHGIRVPGFVGLALLAWDGWVS